MVAPPGFRGKQHAPPPSALIWASAPPHLRAANLHLSDPQPVAGRTGGNGARAKDRFARVSGAPNFERRNSSSAPFLGRKMCRRPFLRTPPRQNGRDHRATAACTPLSGQPRHQATDPGEGSWVAAIYPSRSAKRARPARQEARRAGPGPGASAATVARPPRCRHAAMARGLSSAWPRSSAGSADAMNPCHGAPSGRGNARPGRGP